MKDENILNMILYTALKQTKIRRTNMIGHVT